MLSGDFVDIFGKASPPKSAVETSAESSICGTVKIKNNKLFRKKINMYTLLLPISARGAFGISGY